MALDRAAFDPQAFAEDVWEFRFDWDSSTTYARGQAVDYAGVAYIALLGSLNVIPSSDPLTWYQISGLAPSGGTPALTLGSTNTPGVATTFIRDDDTILAFDGTAPVTQAFGDAAATGSAAVTAHRDHRHGMPANPTPSFAAPTIALGTAAAAGSAATVIRSDATILAFDATAPSTQAFGDAAAVGSATTAPRRDHKHAMPSERAASSTTPAAVGTAAVGTGTTDARSDHVHATGAGTPTASAPGDAAATGAGPAAAMTNHVHGREAFATTAAAVGTSAGGSASTVSHGDHIHATGAGTPSTQAFGDAAAVGTGPAASMTDHKHAMPANPVRAQSSTTPAAVGTAAVGVGTTDARSDHVHATGAGTPSNSAPGDAASTGSGPAAAMTDHKHGREAFGASGDIKAPGTAAAGASGKVADASHVHPMTETINFVIDGGGVVIATGIKGDIVLDFAATIVQATLLADQSGSIVVNLWKAAYSAFPPTVTNKITASAPPTISTATKAQDASLSGWTTAITAGDVVRVNVDSVTTIQRCTLSLKIVRV